MTRKSLEATSSARMIMDQIRQIDAVTLDFMQQMRAKLLANLHKPGWRDDAVMSFVRRIRDETQELQEALLAYPRETQEYRDRVISECVDIANFAMFIADIVKGKSQHP